MDLLVDSVSNLVTGSIFNNDTVKRKRSRTKIVLPAQKKAAAVVQGLIDALDSTQREMAAILGIHERTMRVYCSKGAPKYIIYALKYLRWLDDFKYEPPDNEEGE